MPELDRRAGIQTGLHWWFESTLTPMHKIDRIEITSDVFTLEWCSTTTGFSVSVYRDDGIVHGPILKECSEELTQDSIMEAIWSEFSKYVQAEYKIFSALL